jgi:hypothetical protein
MSMIKCPECSRKVSDKAAACPNCAYPIAQTTEQPEKVQTIEKTSKQLKKQIIWAYGMVIVGIFLAWRGGNTWLLSTTVGILSAFVGVLWLLRIKFLIWWHHE